MMDEKNALSENAALNDIKGNSGNTTMSTHKPSERFMRKPLKARSKASNSERVRVADLVNKLVEKVNTDAPDNGQTKFGGYRPGQPGSGGPPG